MGKNNFGGNFARSSNSGLPSPIEGREREKERREEEERWGEGDEEGKVSRETAAR